MVSCIYLIARMLLNLLTRHHESFKDGHRKETHTHLNYLSIVTVNTTEIPF